MHNKNAREQYGGGDYDGQGDGDVHGVGGIYCKRELGPKLV